jgi:serine phosphatase RsbU (regulator of sigma subunit)/anti-sigma regulatory factor (Ser/Thr protein kinase)
MEQRLVLRQEADAVPRARHFVANMLRGSGLADISPDAELVVTELATNALLHAAPPVTITAQLLEHGVRIEVGDGTQVAPVPGLASIDAMTGRGIALVDMLARRWGVRMVSSGKVIWAEVVSPSVVSRLPLDRQTWNDAKDGAATWTDRVQSGTPERRYQLTLGDVPTDLLLAAKAHVDNLVREFMLAGAGAWAGQTAQVPPRMADLTETVNTRFAEARQAIKRQALAALAAGEERTRLTLSLPLSAAQAGRDYLAALDDADSYARASRLLTLESPPQHRAFRQWYVTTLAEQLEAIAEGRPAPRARTFEQYLLRELEAAVAGQRAADRAARLQGVTSSLAGALTAEEVAAIVLSEGAAALEAAGGALLLPLDDEHLAVPGTIGYGDALVGQLRSEPPDAQLPAAVALRTGEPVWLESRQDRDQQFPELTGLEPSTVSMCAVPLVLTGHVLGALRFSFDSSRLFDDNERQFVLALAAQTAQALDRSALHRAERAARDEAETALRGLARLHQVTASLATASSFDEIVDIVARQSAETLGAKLSALCVLENDNDLRVVGFHGIRQPETVERWSTFPLAAELPASEAVRANVPIVAYSREEVAARWPLLAREVLAEGSLACVPISVGSLRLGALSLSFPIEHVIDDAEIGLLTTIGQQCGLALERARLIADERAARDHFSFLTDATTLLNSSLEPTETLQHLTSLLVPSLADWAVVYLADLQGVVATATASHRDPEIGRWMVQMQRGQPLDVDTPGGIGEILRSGVSIWYPRVPAEIRERTTKGIDDPARAAAIDPQSAGAVPLTARGSIIGALALARTSPDNPYTSDEQTLVEEIAARAAVAVEHAQQFRNERDAALTLQRSLLPQRLPRVDGVAFAWRYLPGAAGTYIGGDWYDVIPLDGDRVALVIGDVMGRGLRAAAVMGQLRATARAHASSDLSPSEILARLDIAVGRLEQDQITTALFAVLDPVTRSLTIASAGHLPPLVATESDAYFLDIEPGPPLGVGSGGFPEMQVQLPDGATLLLFTDGLVEDRRMPVDVGLEKLRVAAAGAIGAEALCNLALVALGRDTEHDDDTALLAVELRPS